MRMLKKLVSAFLITLLLVFAFPAFLIGVRGETFLGWQIAKGPYGIVNGIPYTYGGSYSEFNGVMTLSGDEHAAGPTLFKEISPAADFEISLQIKAETLSSEGGPLSGGSGEGFRLMLQDKGVNPTAGINFELRGRGGGEFWVAYHNPRCDLYGWQCDIVTFMSNPGDIYASQNSIQPPRQPQNPNALVKPDVWYTMKLTVHQKPYTMTSEVYADNGTLLGSLTINDVDNFSFNEIKAVVISTLCGGTFYVKNIAITDIPTVETLQGWHDVSTGGNYTVTDGVVSLTSNGTAGPVFEKEFRPQADFEISLQVKAKTLGEVSLDPLGAGEGFGWGFGTDNVWPSYTISFEMGARSGGQFLLDYGHPNINHSWDWDWTPFVYDGLEYNDGYAFWHSASTAVNRTNAPVRADVWYTLKLKVTEMPFTVTSEVWSENGTLLGSLTWTNIHTFGLKDIRYSGIWSTHGGTFYLRNITIGNIADIPPVDTFEGWQMGNEGGHMSESNGTLTLSGGDGSHLGPCLFKEFTPQGDFEVSFQLKAETLGEVLLDQAGEGFVFSFGNISITTLQFHVVSFWLRARAGGQFLLGWHDQLCDINGWGCNWEPFVYNGIGYNNGYDFWHPNPPVDRSNAPVQPDVWYKVKLKVQETPFVVTGEVYSENGTLLGSLTIDAMNDLTFKDINYLYMSTGAGGTFYLRNLIISGASSSFANLSISAEPSSHVGSPVNIHGTLTDEYGNVLANEPVVLKYSFPGAEEWYPISSALTDASGNYNVQWMTTATGTFTLRAEWKGNSMYPRVYADMTLNSLPFQNNIVFFVESNSTVTSLAFNSTASELSFKVSGASGTTGYVKATIAKNLLPNAQNLRVNLDGNQLSYTLTETADAWMVTFNYSHSTHLLTIYMPTTAATATRTATPAQTETALPAPNHSPSPRGIEYGTWIAIITAAIGITVPAIAGGMALHRRKSTAPRK